MVQAIRLECEPMESCRARAEEQWWPEPDSLHSPLPSQMLSSHSLRQPGSDRPSLSLTRLDHPLQPIPTPHANKHYGAFHRRKERERGLERTKRRERRELKALGEYVGVSLNVLSQRVTDHTDAMSTL